MELGPLEHILYGHLSTSLIERYVYKSSLGQQTLSSLDVASITIMNRKGLRTVSKNFSANYSFEYSQYRVGSSI